jgi:hypothetical protein
VQHSSNHRFIIVIPVADRPRHIQACLDSLCELLRRYPYAGEVSVLIADDSANANNIVENQAIAMRHSTAGLNVIHFGPDEQFALIQSLRETLSKVVGNAPRENSANFGHKGQGAMRNIAYLKVAALLKDMPDENVLIWSLDSDQEFCVKVATVAGDREVYAVDFFNSLDAIFSRTDALVLTGKVVGDPPVSPAVMTGNFLADVSGFLQQMGPSAPACGCTHHRIQGQRTGEAAYHDMADLFGFSSAAEACHYRCPLPGEHSEADCFAHFAARLNSFFYGEHPTRVSYYEHAELFGTVQPARTVYAGNYVFRPEALKYFIPFASLRLRMSGPTLGRIVRAELGPRFVSANLPMLHKRTVESGGQAEFRPGIETQVKHIDMSGEFERQFYGDVMLFSIERLGGDCRPASREADRPEAARRGCADFSTTLDSVRAEMLDKYNTRQRLILDRLRDVETLLHAPAAWWNHAADHAAAIANFTSFVANIRHNFGENTAGHTRINAAGNWEKWRADLLAAIHSYPADRAAWEAVVCAR